jgi:hypothetical protein
VAGTHDYLSWNRVRWEAVTFLVTERRVAAETIDGGEEYGLLFLDEPEAQETRAKLRSEGGYHYVISFAPRAGYEAIWHRRADLWLVQGGVDILVLQRIAPVVDEPASDQPDFRYLYFLSSAPRS